MFQFLSKFSYIFIWIGAIVLVGALFAYVVQSNTHFPTVSSQGNSQYAVTPPPPPPPPPPPSVSLTILKSPKGNQLIVTWENLPGNTTALKIYRGITGKPTSTWTLYKTITINGDFGSGSQTFDIGNSILANYSFFVQAISETTNGTSTTATNITTVTFMSDPIVPTVTTSTPQQTAPPPPANTTPTTTTQNTNTPPPSNNQTANNPPPQQPQQPSGIPYYNPQIQITGFGQPPSGSFYVQHVDQKVQLGWQDLPPSTTEISIYRSPDANGPWSLVLDQKSPGVLDSYAIQLVDDSVGSSFYYEMTAQAGGATIANFGPIFLPAAATTTP